MSEQELQAAAYPRLDAAQMASLERCPLTKLRRYRDGEKLFEAGQRDFSFYVVKSGKVEIVDDSEDPPKTLTTLGPGEFTGEVSQLCGSPAPVSAIARGECEVYEVSPDALRELLNRHPELGDLILHAFMARRQLLRESGKFTGLRVIGSRYSQDTFRIRDFLAKNQVPFTWLDLEADPQVKQLLQRFGVSEADTPVVAWGNKLLLRNPSNRQLAEALGLRRPLEQTVYDLVIVGAGPAGLAAAVYGASEGLNTVVLERAAPGGQAGRSMRIENYLGFPTGITGGRAGRARRRAGQQVRGEAGRRDAGHGPDLRQPLPGAAPRRRREGHDQVSADRHRGRLPPAGRRGLRALRGPRRLLRRHPHRGADVPRVGRGGRRRRQLRRPGRGLPRRAGARVYLVVRGDDLYKDMSSYLAQRIEGTPNIEVLLHTEVRRMSGDSHLSEVELVNKKTGEVRKLRVAALFSFIGAVPRTDWLPPEIEKDDKGFVRTGPALAQSGHWTARRQPFLLETSRPGVFAAGDVRSGSVKRVASAVGEGSMAVQFVHEYLKEM